MRATRKERVGYTGLRRTVERVRKESVCKLLLEAEWYYVVGRTRKVGERERILIFVGRLRKVNGCVFYNLVKSLIVTSLKSLHNTDRSSGLVAK